MRWYNNFFERIIFISFIILFLWQNELALDEKSCKEAMDLFGETKHLLLANVSSIGNGTVHTNITLLWKSFVIEVFIWIHKVLNLFRQKKQSGTGLLLFYTLSRDWLRKMRRVERKKLRILVLPCVEYWEQQSLSIFLTFI